MKTHMNLKVAGLIASLCLLVGCFEGSEPAKKMPEPLDTKTALTNITRLIEEPQKAVDWSLTYQSAITLRSVVDKRTAAIWVQLLERKAPVVLTSTSELPGVMSPLHMLQAEAMRNLRKTGNIEYVGVFQKIYQETDERVLKKMAQEHIQALGGTVSGGH